MRGLTLWLIAALTCAPSIALAQLAEHCDNDIDDDGDSFADCGDPDCVGHPSCPPGGGVEASPRLCRNGVDDDGDGTIDCDDPSCRPFVSCVRHRSTEDTTGAPSSSPPLRSREHDDPRRYPQRHVLAPLTYLAGMLVPTLALSIQNEPALLTSSTRLGLGVTYGIFDLWEVTLLPVPVRLSPTAQYEDPAIATTLRLFSHEVIEIGLYADLAIPVVTGDRAMEPLPLAHPLALSRSSDVAQLDLALRVRLHLADVVRIDLAPPIATLVFAQPDVQVALTFPVSVAVQVTDYGYFGVESGAILPAVSYDEPKIPLALYAGTTIPGSARGPLLDARIRLAWPTFWDGARAGAEVSADGWQITLDARVLTYLLP